MAATLEELWLSYNQIASLEGVQSCLHLRVLYMGNNAVGKSAPPAAVARPSFERGFDLCVCVDQGLERARQSRWSPGAARGAVPREPHLRRHGQEDGQAAGVGGIARSDSCHDPPPPPSDPTPSSFPGHPPYLLSPPSFPPFQVLKRLPKLLKIDNEMVIDAEREQALKV